MPIAAIVIPALTPSLSSLDGGLVMRWAHFSAAAPIVSSADLPPNCTLQRAIARRRRGDGGERDREPHRAAKHEILVFEQGDPA